jgi:hypothetical protein
MRRRWYQKGTVLAIAKAQGFSASEYLFDEWVERGLLGEAGVRIWPGRGSLALWPQEQLDLFLSLLVLRQRFPKNIPLGRLCPIPVGRWLYWGELSGVSLSQVRRALTTWIDFQSKIPEKQVRRDITQAMRRYEGPNATDRRLLIDELVATWVKRKVPERDLLRTLLDPVVNAYPQKAAKGPVRAFMDLAECWSVMHALCFTVLQQERAFLDLPDAYWNWARFFNLLTYGLNLDERSHLASDPQFGDLFARQTVENLCQQACQALITWLGLAHQGDLAPWRAEPLRFLDPELWQRGEVVCTIRTDLRASPLILPGGVPFLYLCHTMALTFQRESQSFPVAIPFR